MAQWPTLYRAAASDYGAAGRNSGWQWWAASRDWAEQYGSAIIERPAAGLRLVTVPLDAADVLDVLAEAGVEVSGIAVPYAGGDDDELLVAEVHQLLADPTSGPALATACRAAGIDGVVHPDHIEGAGVGTAIALVTL